MNDLKRRASQETEYPSKSPRLLDSAVTPRTQRQLLDNTDLLVRWKSMGSGLLDLSTNLAELCKDSVASLIKGPLEQPTNPQLSIAIMPPSQANSETTTTEPPSTPPSPSPSFTFSNSTTNRSFSGTSTQSSITGLTISQALYPPQRNSALGHPRAYKTKPHIFSRQYQASLGLLRENDKDELDSLFSGAKKRGYQSDLKTYAEYLIYAFQLEKLEKDSGFRKSPSVSDLSISSRSNGHQRRHTMTGDPVQLVKAIASARKNFKSSRSQKHWSPTLDQLALLNRTKDEAIENRLRPKRPKLPSSLPPSHQKQVDGFLRQRGLVSKYAREQVSDADISRLMPGQWLNDEIINFYGAMITGRCESSKENCPSTGEKPLNVHYFSSFFWAKLTKDGYAKGRLNKWTKKIDIFSKDVVLIPINHGNTHWTSAAINFRQKRVEAYDSMGKGSPVVYKQLRQYLDLESRDKKKCPFDFSEWEDYDYEDTPQQENCYDCGVFTCQILQALSLGEETFNFSQKDIPYLRRRMIWEIGNGRFWESPA